MPHRPSFAASRSLCLALMTSAARTVTVETKAAHRREAANCMIVTLSVCVSQRSDIVSYKCRKVLVLLETKWLPVWVRRGADFCAPIVSGSGCSKCKYIWSDHVWSLTGRAAVKSPSEWVSCVRPDGRSFISSLCSCWHSPADTLWPTLARTTDREEEWENNQQRREWEKGLSCHDDFSPSCPFRIWLVFRWFLCGRLIDFLPFQSAKQWSVVTTSIKLAKHSQPKEIAAAVGKNCPSVWWGGCVFISSPRRHFRVNSKSLMKPKGENCYLSTGPILFSPPPHCKPTLQEGWIVFLLPLCPYFSAL